MDLCGYLDIGHVDIQMWTKWCGNRCKFGEMYNTNWMWYLDVVIGCGNWMWWFQWYLEGEKCFSQGALAAIRETRRT